MITINSKFENLPCGYVLLTKQGVIKDVNKKFIEMIGYSFEEVINAHIEDFLSVVSKMFFHSMFFSQLSNLGFVEELYFTFKSKNGFDIPIIFNSAPEEDGFITCILVRISKRIEYEEELQKIKEKLEAAYKEKDLALENEKKRAEELKYLSYHDQLTGAFNRHFFDTIITDEMDRSDANNEPISMLILDLDHFKKVNDTWGHPVGDEVLKLTVKTANEFKSETDFLIRLGGEEFVILMPHTKIEDAASRAEIIRDAIEKKQHPITGKQTVSIGVAEKLKYESFKNWYRRIDASLYNAKQGGRNQVVASDGNKSFPNIDKHLEWKEESMTGNEEIDKQHKDFSMIANNLITLVQQNVERQEIGQGLKLLSSHILNHFKSEEEYLLDIKYPELSRHADIHKNLAAKILQVNNAYGKNEIEPSALLSFIVDDLMIDHFQNEDIKYFIYIK